MILIEWRSSSCTISLPHILKFISWQMAIHICELNSNVEFLWYWKSAEDIVIFYLSFFLDDFILLLKLIPLHKLIFLYIYYLNITSLWYCWCHFLLSSMLTFKINCCTLLINSLLPVLSCFPLPLSVITIIYLWYIIFLTLATYITRRYP